MTFLTQIALILGTLSTAGVLCDRMLVRRHKTSLHTKLVALWSRIDDTRIGDLPGAVAGTALRAFERIFGTSLINRRVLILSVVLSFVLTTGRGLIIYFWAHTPYRVWHDLLPFWPFYVSDYIFNSATIVVAILALRRLRRATFLRSIMVTFVTIGIAFGLAVAGLEVGYWTCDFASHRDVLGAEFFNNACEGCSCHVEADTFRKVAMQMGVPQDSIAIDNGGTALMEFSDISKAYLSLFTTGHPAVHRVLFTSPLRKEGMIVDFRISAPSLVLNAGMLFLVTLLLVVVSGAVLAKTLLTLARFASLFVLEAVTEIDPAMDPKSFMPATLLGTFLGVVGAIIRAMTELVRS